MLTDLSVLFIAFPLERPEAWRESPAPEGAHAHWVAIPQGPSSLRGFCHSVQPAREVHFANSPGCMDVLRPGLANRASPGEQVNRSGPGSDYAACFMLRDLLLVFTRSIPAARSQGPLRSSGTRPLLGPVPGLRSVFSRAPLLGRLPGTWCAEIFRLKIVSRLIVQESLVGCFAL